MDHTQTITHLGLCAGYGGIELGLKRVIPTLRSIALCEIEAFACANLVSKMEAGLMDPAPIWTDLKTFPWESFRDRVDLLTGGYPCQPFSAAGKRLGTDDPRHLWPFIAKGIRILQPRLCFFENVEGHISLGLSDVIEDLGRLGYRTAWGIFSASECGAPHQRKRVFVMAHRCDKGLERSAIHRNWLASSRQWEIEKRHTGQGCSNLWPSCPGQPQYGWEPPRVVGDQGRQIKFPLGGNFNEPASGMDYAELYISCDNRTDELRLLGNGVVPATAALAFRALMTDLCSPPS